MPEFTFWEIVLLGFYLVFIQFATRHLIEKVGKWFEKRRDNTIYTLYINDVSDGKHSLKDCREKYENTSYKTMKSSGRNRKKREFYINVDNR